jgi:hypothetical protein
VTLVTSSPPLHTVTPLAALNPVFDQWRKVLAAYAQAVPGDLPWWYNETAAVGFLAAATWRAGGVAIVDFDNKRQSTERKRAIRGRCDLYLKHRESAFYAEAKQVFHWLDDTPDHSYASDDIRRRLDEAAAQVSGLKCDEDASLFALVFASPRLEVKHRDQLRPLLKHWVAAMRKVECTRRIEHIEHNASSTLTPDEDGLLYPGTVLFVREVSSCPR